MPGSLQDFLTAELSEKAADLDDDEFITDAVVLFRVSSLDGDDAINERYCYTVTQGVNLAMAFGMLDLTRGTIMDYYQSLLDKDDD